MNDDAKYYQCTCGKLHLIALMKAVTEAAKEYRCGLCTRVLAVWVVPPEQNEKTPPPILSDR